MSMNDVEAVKGFLSRGNALMIAVGVALGYIFAQLMIAVANGLVAPVIGAIVDKDNFLGAMFTINGNQFYYGQVIGLAIAFVLAVVVYAVLANPRRR